jgi:hypothetical protein
MAIDQGSRLGPYEVRGSIGSGGMGEVYRARDPRLGRDVAIKVLATMPLRRRATQPSASTRRHFPLGTPNHFPPLSSPETPLKQTEQLYARLPTVGLESAPTCIAVQRPPRGDRLRIVCRLVLAGEFAETA